MNALKWLLAGVGGFLLWQWYQSRRTSPELSEHLSEQSALQRLGKVSTAAAAVATPPLFGPASGYDLATYSAAVTQPSILPDGSVVIGTDKDPSQSRQPSNPFLFPGLLLPFRN